MDVDRICFVSLPLYGFFNPAAYEQTGGGGGKRQLALLSPELQDRFEVHAIVGDYGQPERERREGVVLHRAYEPGTPAVPVKFYRLLGAMRRADADVYVYRGHPRLAAAVSVAATLLGRAWVYNIGSDADLGIDYERCSPPVRWAFRRGLSRAHAVIAQTDHQQQLLSKRFDTASAIVPNGYPPVSAGTDSDQTPSDGDQQPDADASSNLNGMDGPETDEAFLLWVGRIEEEQKRPHLLLDCAERLPEREFVLVGPRAEEAYAEQIADRCRTLPNAEYIGPVEPHEIHQLYTDALALINTSAYEGFPNTFLEAWRQGVPVVSLDVDPGRYLEDVSFTGYADGSLDTLLKQVQGLTEDGEYRRHVGSELKQYFEQTYQISVVAETYGTVLAEGVTAQR